MIGPKNKGLNSMFTMMNLERIVVGIQGLGISETAYQNSLSYAKERKQGKSNNSKSTNGCFFRGSKKEKYFESKTFTAGKKIKSFNLPWGKLGLSICYDLRFPNLFRKLSKAGSLFISIPSAFTETTGKRHWHSLLKARAIENFCYIFAPAQGGAHYNGRKTFGHSMVVSPDGKILKELKKSEGVITVSIDKKLPIKLRTIIPSLKSD